MKLYFTSYRIPAPQELFELVGKSPEEIRTAVIPNAQDYYADRARAVKIRQVTDYLSSVGLNSSLVDLRSHARAHPLERKLKEFDLLWIMGGNTFCLRSEMHRSGFDQVIGSVLASGVVYGGESAGAVAAGTSLRGIELADNPEFVDPDHIVMDGLKLAPYFVLPHIDDDRFKDAVNAAREIYSDPAKRLELTNSQVAIIEDGNVRFLEGARQE
jgi:dipeptidase E